MIRLNTFRLQASRASEVLRLTPNEYRILHLFHDLKVVYPYEMESILRISRRQLHTHICVLNTKLESLGSKKIELRDDEYAFKEKIKLVDVY